MTETGNKVGTHSSWRFMVSDGRLTGIPNDDDHDDDDETIVQMEASGLR